MRAIVHSPTGPSSQAPTPEIRQRSNNEIQAFPQTLQTVTIRMASPPVQVPPIEVIFTAACVRAIRGGHKHQARRVVRTDEEPCPFGQTGDRLVVRAPKNDMPDTVTVVIDSVHRERLHTLSDDNIVEEGAGHVFPWPADTNASAAFAAWWDAVHLRTGTRWADNPFVWVVRFHRAPEAPA